MREGAKKILRHDVSQNRVAQKLHALVALEAMAGTGGVGQRFREDPLVAEGVTENLRNLVEHNLGAQDVTRTGRTNCLSIIPSEATLHQ